MNESVITPVSSKAIASESMARDLSLAETLRVLEVARGIRSDRRQAELALSRNELRESLRKRLLDAAVITGDSVTEAEVDAAITQYFQTQHVYTDPEFSFSVFLAHLYVRRNAVLMLLGGLAVLYLLVF
jgi:hypothetical protein